MSKIVAMIVCVTVNVSKIIAMIVRIDYKCFKNSCNDCVSRLKMCLK